MTRCEEIRLELAGLISGELSTQTAITVNVHLRGCDACTRELAELRGTISVLREAPLQDDPAADLEGRVFELAVLEQVGAMVSSAPLETDPPGDLEARALVRAGVLDSIAKPLRSRWAKVSMVLAPSLAATAVVFGFLATQWHDRINELEESFGPMGQSIASLQLTSFDNSNQASAELFDAADTNYRLALRSDRFRPTPPGFHYEVWLTGDEGSVTIGSFRVVGTEDIVFIFPIGVAPSDYPHLAISLEPDDGNPAPNGETIMEANFSLP